MFQKYFMIIDYYKLLENDYSNLKPITTNHKYRATKELYLKK